MTGFFGIFRPSLPYYDIEQFVPVTTLLDTKGMPPLLVPRREKIPDTDIIVKDEIQLNIAEKVPALPPRLSPKSSMSRSKPTSPNTENDANNGNEFLLPPRIKIGEIDNNAYVVPINTSIDTQNTDDPKDEESSEATCKDDEDSYYITPIQHDDVPSRDSKVGRSSSLNSDGGKDRSSYWSKKSLTSATDKDDILSQIYDVFSGKTRPRNASVRRCLSDVSAAKDKKNDNSDYDYISCYRDLSSSNLSRNNDSFKDSGICSTADERSYKSVNNNDCVLRVKASRQSYTDSLSMQSEVSLSRTDHCIVKDLLNSEAKYVCDLKLINFKLKDHLSKEKSETVRVIAQTILESFPQLYEFNEQLLDDLTIKFSLWDQQKKGISEVFIKMGPFLKIYNSYINKFHSLSQYYKASIANNTKFRHLIHSFQEKYDIDSLMDVLWKPVKRIPEYYALLQEYKCSLAVHDDDFSNTSTAINIIGDVLDHARQIIIDQNAMDQMIHLQNVLRTEIIRPARTLVRDDIFNKLTKKSLQPRRFVIMNDAILYCTRTAKGYKLKEEINLLYIKIHIPDKETYPNEFRVKFKDKTMILSANTSRERDRWIDAVHITREEMLRRCDSLLQPENIIDEALYNYRAEDTIDKTMTMPEWIPDACVTMCQLCTANFTLTYRRHHCRACGKVVCGFCSKFRVKIGYMDSKPGRVCEKCYINLTSVTLAEGDDSNLDIDMVRPIAVIDEKISINSKRKERPKILKVAANSDDVELSGYLKLFRRGKWKKYWCVIKGMAMYKYRASEDSAAKESIVLLGYTVSSFKQYYEGIQPDLLFKLAHSGNIEDAIFQTDAGASTKRWMQVIESVANIS